MENNEKRKWHITFNAPVVLGFGFICFCSLILGIITGGRSTHALFMTYHNSLASPLTWLRFFTHVCGHANWAHLIGNMSYILLLGPMLEEKYGSKTIIEIICLTAGITGIFNWILFPHVALLGASGVVFAFIVLASFTGFKDGEIPVTFILVAIIYIGQQIYDGITVQDNISNLSHILGGVVGGLSGFIMNKEEKG